MWDGSNLWCVYEQGWISSVAPTVRGLCHKTGVFYLRIFFERTLNHLRRLLQPWTHCGSPPCRPTGQEMRLPHHRALGQHDNWGRLFVSRWLCDSLQHVFGVDACGVHQSATSQLHLELSAVPIIAWHHHPYLFSWKFIIYDTSSFLPLGNWMLLSC